MRAGEAAGALRASVASSDAALALRASSPARLWLDLRGKGGEIQGLGFRVRGGYLHRKVGSGVYTPN